MARGSTNALGKLPIIVNPNLLDNWYFGGAEIWAKSGAPYHKDDGSQIGTLSSDAITKNNPNSAKWLYVIVDGAQYQVHIYYCYQKQGTGPVNQRGEVSYTSTSTSITYTIDRFKHSMATLTVKNDCINWKSNKGANYKRIMQMFNATLKAGITYTFSALVNVLDYSYVGMRFITSSYGSIPNTDVTFIDKTGMQVLSVTVTPSADLTGFGVEFLCGNTTDSYLDADFYAMKLELGDTQTLARQEANGTWVLNEIPNYGEQLARCLIYQRVIDAKSSYGSVGLGIASNQTKITVLVPLGVRMRARPVVTYSGEWRLYYPDDVLIPTAIDMDQDSSDFVRLACTVSGATPGRTYHMQALNDKTAKIILDADL